MKKKKLTKEQFIDIMTDAVKEEVESRELDTAKNRGVLRRVDSVASCCATWELALQIANEFDLSDIDTSNIRVSMGYDILKVLTDKEILK